MSLGEAGSHLWDFRWLSKSAPSPEAAMHFLLDGATSVTVIMGNMSNIKETKREVDKQLVFSSSKFSSKVEFPGERQWLLTGTAVN